MSTTMSAMEARQNFGKLLNIVSLKREDVIIERAGKKIARITSCNKLSKSSQCKLDFRKARGLGCGLWSKVDVKNYISSERKEWD